MYTKITLDMLTETSVSVRTQEYIEDGGIEYAVGEPHRRAYINSERGREELAAALENGLIAQNDFDSIMAKWGENPTVVETDGFIV